MTWWDKTKEKANKTFINAHDAAFGPLTSSKFLMEGVLTPEEVPSQEETRSKFCFLPSFLSRHSFI